MCKYEYSRGECPTVFINSKFTSIMLYSSRITDHRVRVMIDFKFF